MVYQSYEHQVLYVGKASAAETDENEKGDTDDDTKLPEEENNQDIQQNPSTDENPQTGMGNSSMMLFLGIALILTTSLWTIRKNKKTTK